MSDVICKRFTCGHCDLYADLPWRNGKKVCSGPSAINTYAVDSNTDACPVARITVYDRDENGVIVVVDEDKNNE